MSRVHHQQPRQFGKRPSPTAPGTCEARIKRLRASLQECDRTTFVGAAVARVLDVQIAEEKQRLYRIAGREWTGGRAR